MAILEPEICEVKIDGAWTPVGAGEAHAHHRLAAKRCPVCHGPVMTTSTFVRPIRVRLSHRRAHDDCPLLPTRYAGTPTPHPGALE